MHHITALWPSHKGMTGLFRDYIYMYSFRRHIYPKQLTVQIHISISMCVPWLSNSSPWCCVAPCSTSRAMEADLKSQLFLCILSCKNRSNVSYRLCFARLYMVICLKNDVHIGKGLTAITAVLIWDLKDLSTGFKHRGHEPVVESCAFSVLCGFIGNRSIWASLALKHMDRSGTHGS